mgnify:CR=1 FL=1
MVKSMTGFGKGEATLQNKKITVEIRSLNSKQLDLGLRLPAVYRQSEYEIRNIITRTVQRGKVDVFVTVESQTVETPARINKEVFAAYAGQLRDAARNAQLNYAGIGWDSAALQAIMRLPEVVSTEAESISDEEHAALVAATGSWRLLLPVYAALTVAGGIWLRFTGVEEPQTRGGAVGMIDCFRLLAHPTVALCAFGVAAFIAADVGIGFLSSRLLDNPDSILTSTGFYACRIVGTIVGAWLLVRYSDVKYLRWNMCGALALATALLFVRSDAAVYLLVGLLGFAMACVFATVYAVATKSAPTKSNEVAGLMIMMIAAGAVSGPAVGALIRVAGDVHYGLLFVMACIGYLVWASFRIETETTTEKTDSHA